MGHQRMQHPAAAVQVRSARRAEPVLQDGLLHQQRGDFANAAKIYQAVVAA